MYIKKEKLTTTKFSYKIGYSLELQPYSIFFFLLKENFDKSTIGSNFLLIFSILEKFQEFERSIA